MKKINIFPMNYDNCLEKNAFFKIIFLQSKPSSPNPLGGWAPKC